MKKSRKKLKNSLFRSLFIIETGINLQNGSKLLLKLYFT